MFKTIQKYKSSLEKTYIILQNDKTGILFWLCSKENGKPEVLSFENFYQDKDTAIKLVEWFKRKEAEGIPPSKAAIYLETEATALENAMYGTPKKQAYKY